MLPKTDARAQEASGTLDQPGTGNRNLGEQATTVKHVESSRHRGQTGSHAGPKGQRRKGSTRCRSFATRLQPLSLKPRRLLLPFPAPLGQPEMMNHKEDLVSGGGQRNPAAGRSARCQQCARHQRSHQVPPAPRKLPSLVFRDALQLSR